MKEFIRENGDEIWDWLRTMSCFGARYTGNVPHQNYIQFIKEQLNRFDLPVFTDQYKFCKWEASRAKLFTGEEGGEEQLPVLSYYPYSGATGENGLRGEVVFCKNRRQLKKAAGKIAVVEINNILLPTRLVLHVRKGNTRLPGFLRHPVVGSTILGPNLSDAEQYGVLGVVCVWKHCPDEVALGQYLPFTAPQHRCPAVWVGKAEGERLKKLAKRGGSARLVLNASVEEDAASETVYTVLPGRKGQESILINTHTDGPNACEENGGIALLALAKYFSGIPQEEREKTLIFVFATGHFQIPQFGVDGKQATSRWLRDHEDLWSGKNGGKRAVAGVTLEHLGCMKWTGAEGDSPPGGLPECEWVYTSDQKMDRIYWDAARGRTKMQSVTLKPGKFYFGEGEPLFQASIPTISLVPAPLYLCSEAPDGHLDKIDRELMLQQIETFANVIRTLDRRGLTEQKAKV